MAEEQIIQNEEPKKKLKPETITVFEIADFDVMFTSLCMILLAFFIVMNSMAVMDPARERAVIGSLLGSFGVLPSGVGTNAEEGTVSPAVEEVSLTDEVVLFAAFEAFLEEEQIQDTDIEVFVDKEGRRRIRFSEKFLFGPDSIRFHPRVMPVLDKLAIIFKKLKRSIEVEGHTDIKRGNRSNWLLSAQRSALVVRYFEEASKLPFRLLTAVGFGSSRPRNDVVDNALNRRIELVVN